MAESSRSRLDDDAPPVAPPAPTSPQTRPVTGTDTVTVACKMPGGLRLRLFRKEDSFVPMFGGGVSKETISRPIDGAMILIRGPRHLGGTIPPDMMHSFMPGGYALTSGVPRDFWEQWLEDNKHSDLVKNKIVYAADREDLARDQAREQHELQSGLQPIDPDNIGKRIPRMRLPNGQMEPAIETMPVEERGR
jgi:hypothetical protein